METATKVAKYITENAQKHAEIIVQKVMDVLNLQIPEWEQKAASTMYKIFFDHLADSMEIDTYRVPEEVLKWSVENAERTAKSGRDIYEIMRRYPPSRMIVSNFITEICMEHNVSVFGTACLTKKINAMFDISINETLVAYGRMKEELENQMREELAMMSAPLVLIEDKTYIIPLAGAIDEFRLSYIKENTFEETKKTKADYVLIDFTRASKEGDWTAQHNALIDLFVNGLTSTIMIIGAGQELLPNLSTLLRKRENIELCSSVAQAVEVTRQARQETSENLA